MGLIDCIDRFAQNDAMLIMMWNLKITLFSWWWC